MNKPWCTESRRIEQRQRGLRVGQPGNIASRSTLVIAVSAGALASLVTACGGGDPASRAAASPTPSPQIAQEEKTGRSRPGERLYVVNCQVCHGTQSGQGGVVGAPSHNETGHTGITLTLSSRTGC